MSDRLPITTAQPVKNDQPACGSCRFWKPHPGNGEGTGWGQCKRMPPALPEVRDEKLVLAGIWPSTDESDWCGEWQLRELAPESPIEPA